MLFSPVLVLFISFGCILFVVGPRLFFMRRHWILRTNIKKPNDIFTNIMALIPSEDEVDLLEEKALVSLQDIKEAISSKFNCAINILLSGSMPERFGVPFVDDWIDDIGTLNKSPGLLSDQDFLIEPSTIIASYSFKCSRLEIVQDISCKEEGFAMLKVSKSLARRCNLKEGFLSTEVIKDSLLKCLKKVSLTHFPGIVRRSRGLLESLFKSKVRRKVQVHGPAVNLTISTLEGSNLIYLADFIFAIPCFQWPRESDWPSRNKKWPDHKVVATIKERGFHFIPRNKENDKSNFTWRYSFSKAERELSKHVNQKARICFLCLKIISVDHLKPIYKKLKSYHLKTILFHTLEVTSAETWTQESILNCLNYLLEEVQDAFHHQRCRHFWISHINLFQDLKHCKLSKLEKKVKTIRENPLPFVSSYFTKFKSSCLPCFTKQELCCCCIEVVSDYKYLKTRIKKKHGKE